MRRVLITGVSGVGKSTVVAELAARGFAVVDTDYGGYCSPGPDVEQRDRTPPFRERAVRRGSLSP